MSPRQRITSSAYAIRAERAEDANTVGNVGVNTTPVANKILPLDSNAKIPQSAIALKVYDSGWFAVSTWLVYTKTHNLGTTRVLIQVFFSTTPDGSSNVIALNWASRDWTANGDRQLGACIRDITSTNIVINTGENVADKYNGSNLSWYTSGYYRVVMLALE